MGDLVLLNKKDAILLERQPRKNGGPRLVYTFNCSTGCGKTTKVRSSDLKNSQGKCASCSRVKRPYESIFNGIKNDWRKIEVTLNYEEFLEFTKIITCHYCPNDINWVKYSTFDGKFTSRAYYLDRKDNQGPYSKENVVVCCSTCNRARGNRYTYEEWYGMTEYLRKQK